MAVEDTLGDNYLGGIGATNTDIGHDSDADVLLERKWARVKGPSESKSIEFLSGKNGFQKLPTGKGDELNDNSANKNGGIWKLIRR